MELRVNSDAQKQALLKSNFRLNVHNVHNTLLQTQHTSKINFLRLTVDFLMFVFKFKRSNEEILNN